MFWGRLSTGFRDTGSFYPVVPAFPETLESFQFLKETRKGKEASPFQKMDQFLEMAGISTPHITLVRQSHDYV